MIVVLKWVCWRFSFPLLAALSCMHAVGRRRRTFDFQAVACDSELGGNGSFESTVAATGFAIGVGVWASLIYDLID